MNLENWRKAVKEHETLKNSLSEDEKVLKEHLESHLRRFFDGFIEIDFSENFEKITLKWYKQNTPHISNEIIHELGMDWVITVGRDECAYSIVQIEVYPFGLEEDSS